MKRAPTIRWYGAPEWLIRPCIDGIDTVPIAYQNSNLRHRDFFNYVKYHKKTAI